MVCLMSAAEVTRLTRMGKFDMSAPTSGPMAFLKKLRGKSSADVNTSADDKTTAGARQMRMLRLQLLAQCSQFRGIAPDQQHRAARGCQRQRQCLADTAGSAGQGEAIRFFGAAHAATSERGSER